VSSDTLVSLYDVMPGGSCAMFVYPAVPPGALRTMKLA
jgi:hypothetical protein